METEIPQRNATGLLDLADDTLLQMTKYLETQDCQTWALVSKATCMQAYDTMYRTLLGLHIDAVKAPFGGKKEASTVVAESASMEQLRKSFADFYHDNYNIEKALTHFSTLGRDTKGLYECMTVVCISVTRQSGPHVWDVLLSLPNLVTVWVIGDWAINGEPQLARPAAFRDPAARKIQAVRLRGYVPVGFVDALCTGSAKTLRSLDLGTLEPGETLPGEEEIHAPPESSLYFSQAPVPRFEHLTQVSLCSGGPLIDTADGQWSDAQKLCFTQHHERVRENWKALLQATRASLRQVILDQRPVFQDTVLEEEDENEGIRGMQGGTDDWDDGRKEDDKFYEMLDAVFSSSKDWPRLTQLSLRGVRLNEQQQKSLRDRLSGVQVEVMPSRYMWFVVTRGAIVNSVGSDGLIPDFDSTGNPYWFEELWEDRNPRSN